MGRVGRRAWTEALGGGLKFAAAPGGGFWRRPEIVKSRKINGRGSVRREPHAGNRTQGIRREVGGRRRKVGGRRREVEGRRLERDFGFCAPFGGAPWAEALGGGLKS